MHWSRSVELLCLTHAGEKGKDPVSGKRLHYEGSTFHRIIPNFMIQGVCLSECILDSTHRETSHAETAQAVRPSTAASSLMRPSLCLLLSTVSHLMW